MASGKLAHLEGCRSQIELLRQAQSDAKESGKANAVVLAAAQIRQYLEVVSELESQTNVEGLTDEEVEGSLKIARETKQLSMEDMVLRLAQAIEAVPPEHAEPLRRAIAKIPK